MTRERHDGTCLILHGGRVLGNAAHGDPSGTPIIGFHGMPGSRLMMKEVEKAALASGARIIAPEHPDYGLSHPSPNGTLLEYPEDVVELADVPRRGHQAEASCVHFPIDKTISVCYSSCIIHSMEVKLTSMKLFSG